MLINSSNKVSEQQEEVYDLAIEWMGNIDDNSLYKLPMGPIHGDIMFENMKFKRDKLLGIFDFDDCRESYFLEDIAKTLLFKFEDSKKSFFGQNGENIYKFLNEYEKIRKFTLQEKMELPFFFQTRAVYELTGYIIKIKNKKKCSEKITSYLRRYNKYINFFKNQSYL